MHSFVRPNTYAVLELPSGLSKIVEMVPNATISIGKYGVFSSNSLLGRPYHATFEISDKSAESTHSQLRIVPAVELYAGELLSEPESLDAIAADTTTPEETTESLTSEPDEKASLMRSNQFTVDDGTRQTLTLEEIEALKQSGVTNAGRAIIARLKASHQALWEKTEFSLAKYATRKGRKYLKRFVLRPMDPLALSSILLEREASRILELREETMALIGAWSNVFYGAERTKYMDDSGTGLIGGGRWLVVDETCGLVVAALAEKMGILYEDDDTDEDSSSEYEEEEQCRQRPQQPLGDSAANHDPMTEVDSNTVAAEIPISPQRSRRRKLPPTQGMSASQNALTVLHAASQPSLGLLKYFSFDPSVPSKDSKHPLRDHLHTVSWLQLLEPEADTNYNTEIPIIEPAILASMKSNRRGAYHHKRRRQERTRRVVDATRAGGFDGLVIATAGASTAGVGASIELTDMFRHCLPLLRGGAQVVVYCPHSEPLAELADLYSKERRAAWVQFENSTAMANGTSPPNGVSQTTRPGLEASDFPLDPSLLLSPSIQHVRAREWQVMPGRTHPLMTGRGGAEGYVFTATRVLPATRRFEARGSFQKRKKTELDGGGSSSSVDGS